MPISRLHTGFKLRGTGAQYRHSAISVACTIEPFEFPSYIKVTDVRNKLLQLRRHLQCILKPLHQFTPFKASPSLKVLNYLLLVSSNALTLQAHYICKLRKRIAPSREWHAISRLAHNFGILRMHSAISRMCSGISRLRKFLDCAEHMYHTICSSLLRAASTHFNGQGRALTGGSSFHPNVRDIICTFHINVSVVLTHCTNTHPHTPTCAQKVAVTVCVRTCSSICKYRRSASHTCTCTIISNPHTCMRIRIHQHPYSHSHPCMRT